MEEIIPYKKIIRLALITSPLFGLLGATPVLVLHIVEFSRILMGFLLITSIALVFWVINVGLLAASRKILLLKTSRTRHLVSVLIVMLLVIAVFSIFLKQLDSFDQVFKDIPKDILLKYFTQRRLIFPLIQTQSINIIVIVVLEIVLLRNKQQRIENENTVLRMANLEAKHSQLKQQLHPHFLFNSLNILRSLINRSPEQASDYLEKLSELLRFSIHSNSHTLISLKDELELTTNYLQMQQVRFGNALKFTIDIAVPLQTMGKVPVYSLQLLTENAIKHNSLTQQLPLHISINGNNTEMAITVSNNFQPKKTMEQSTGVGLANLSERYKLLGKDDIAINRTNNMFSVVIKVLENESGNN